MNTPAHLIFGLTAFGRAGQPRVTAAALAGGLIPDLSLYLMAGWHLYVLETPAETVFETLYFSPEWQAVFRIDNSVPLWTLGLALALWSRSAWGVALTGAALLHLGLDIGFHHDDGRAHFWPLSTWVFQSPFSYWDPRHFGGIVGPLEFGLALACCGLLWRRFLHWAMRLLIVALGVMELATMVMWARMFAGQ